MASTDFVLGGGKWLRDTMESPRGTYRAPRLFDRVVRHIIRYHAVRWLRESGLHD